MHEIFTSMNNFFQSHGVMGLALNSFIESFFLVPPPDFLLIVMDLAQPSKALFYAFICTIASALGGGIGYGIGYWGGRPAFKFLFKKHLDKLDAASVSINSSAKEPNFAISGYASFIKSKLLIQPLII